MLLFKFVTFVVLAFPVFIVGSSTCSSQIPIEHFFFDLQKSTNQYVDTSHLENNNKNNNNLPLVSPVSVKLKCKAAGCPELNGTKKVMFHDVPHHQEEVNDVFPLFVEETSGWLLFYRDAEWKLPLILTEKTITSKEQEQGFVYFETRKGSSSTNGGFLKFGCS